MNSTIRVWVIGDLLLHDLLRRIEDGTLTAGEALAILEEGAETEEVEE